MPSLHVGDPFPDDITFSYVEPTPENEAITACGTPVTFDASAEFADKRVVLIGVPGAFTPTCSANHIPPYVAQLPVLNSKGIDIVAVVASNDAWVMDAWRKSLGVGVANNMLFLSDPGARFSQLLDFAQNDGTGTNGVIRAARYAVVIEAGRITYAEREPTREISVSGVEAVLAKL